MKTVYLTRDDFRTDVHSFFWEETLEYLVGEENLPESRSDYPDEVKLEVALAEPL